MSQTPRHIAIAGATGAVGVELMQCLEQRNFPISKLTLLASARSAGKKMTFRGEEVEVQELTPDSFEGVDIALFSAGGGISKEFAPHAVKAGAIVVDNSSAFRLDEGTPLVVPEVNGEDTQNNNGIIANPNCTTIISLMALNPLHKAFGGVKSIIASSYQAVSGSGAQGLAELENQVNAIAKGDPLPERNVRVPVFRSHAVSITAVFNDKPSVEAAREAIAAAPGVQVKDDPFAESPQFPTPLDCTNGDDCLVGRIREDLVLDNALTFWVVGDQVRKGAALNAVQIAELL